MAEITVAEALRVKNELAGLVSELQQKVAYASCGDTYEDGVLTSKKNAGSVTEVLPLLEKALSLSHAVHSTLARFNNAQTDLADSVRKLENVKVLQRTLSSILLKSEPTTTTSFSALSNARVKVNVEFKPFFSKSELKARLKSLKTEQRELQNKVDTLNSHTISLQFELEELEELEV